MIVSRLLNNCFTILNRILICLHLARADEHNQNTWLLIPLITPLNSSWMRLCFLTDPRGKVPVKVVARTFASGKTEKLVYQCLSELGLPSGKNEAMEKEAFTFDKFYALYHKICPRNDIEELFRSMLVLLPPSQISRTIDLVRPAPKGSQQPSICRLSAFRCVVVFTQDPSTSTAVVLWAMPRPLPLPHLFEKLRAHGLWGLSWETISQS